MRHTFARIFFGAMSSAGESVSSPRTREAAADRVEAAIGLVLTGLRSLARVGAQPGPRLSRAYFAR